MFDQNFQYRINKKIQRLIFKWINFLHFLTINKLKKIDLKLSDMGMRLSLTVHSQAEFKSINNDSQGKISESDFAIVFHGKFYDNFQKFTLAKNIKQLRTAYPKTKILLSTYKSDIAYDDLLHNIGIDILDCEDVGELPTPYSPNLSRQIETTITGLTHAKELGVKYAVKVRVDQSISPVNFLELCLAMINNFPIKEHNKSIPVNERKRLFVTSYNTFRRKPLHISDMLMFGELDSLILYWKRCHPREFMIETNILVSKYSHGDWNKFQTPEVWLAARYLEQFGYDLSVPALSNDSAWRNEFGIIDSVWIGQTWMKSLSFLNTNLAINTWFFRKYFSKATEELTELNFKDWWTQYYL